MKNLLISLVAVSFSSLSLASVWIQNPIEHFSTMAKEEILAPIQAKKNFSGLSFVPDTKSYYAIINRGDRMYEFDENFNLKREITISGFDDPEDLSFIKMTAAGPLFAISEETGKVLMGVIPAGKELHAKSMKKITLVDEAGRVLAFNDNKGLEGIIYLPHEDRLVVIKEKNPIKVWAFNYADTESSQTVKVKNYLTNETEISVSDLVTDLSAVSYNAKTKSLVLLSDESSKLIYVDDKTTEISKVIDIKTKLQHEGLSFSADYETTYVGSEPYYLFRIKKTNTIQGSSL